MAIAQAQIGTSIGDIYTSTNNSATTVIFFCNTTSSDATVSAYAVASGGTAGATNQIIKDLLNLEAELMEQSKIEIWKKNIFSNHKKIRQTINQVTANKGEIYGYGAPTKSTLSCKVINIEKNDIREILEDNQIKTGRYLPVLGIPIVSKFSSQITSSDLIICFAWNFIEAIINNIRNEYGSNISIISTQNGKIYKT